MPSSLGGGGAGTCNLQRATFERFGSSSPACRCCQTCRPSRGPSARSSSSMRGRLHPAHRAEPGQQLPRPAGPDAGHAQQLGWQGFLRRRRRRWRLTANRCASSRACRSTRWAGSERSSAAARSSRVARSAPRAWRGPRAEARDRDASSAAMAALSWPTPPSISTRSGSSRPSSRSRR